MVIEDHVVDASAGVVCLVVEKRQHACTSARIEVVLEGSAANTSLSSFIVCKGRQTFASVGSRIIRKWFLTIAHVGG